MPIQSFFKNKIKQKFVKNILTLLTGTVTGQLIVFLTIPILTRMFSEEVFGVFALFSSTVILLKLLATLNFELAIILPKRDKDAINLFVFNLILILLFSILLFLVVLKFKNYLTFFFKIEQLSSFIYLVPLSIFLMGNISALEYWNNRKNEFKNISSGIIFKSGSMSFFQLITGISTYKSIGLIPGMIVGQFINFIILIKLSFTSVISLKNHISLKRILYLVSKYRDIPMFNTMLSFVNNLSNELPIILISKYFGFASAGLYSLASKISKTPPGIISESISQVFYNEASIIYNNGGNFYNLFKEVQKTLVLLALIIFIPIFIISFYLEYIFGENWMETGLYVRILTPLLFLSFLISPVSSIITILNKQKIILLIDILKLFFRFIAIYIGYSVFDSVIVSLSLFSGIGVVFNILILIYFFKISKKSNQYDLLVYN